VVFIDVVRLIGTVVVVRKVVVVVGFLHHHPVHLHHQSNFPPKAAVGTAGLVNEPDCRIIAFW
jgi:hypothetical protein